MKDWPEQEYKNIYCMNYNYAILFSTYRSVLGCQECFSNGKMCNNFVI